MGSNRVGSNYISKKINIFILLIYVAIVASFIYSLTLIKGDKSREDKGNILRVETSLQRDKINEMFKENNFYMEDEFYNYAVINLKCKVVFSSIKEFNIGDRVNIEKSIGYDNAFSRSKELIRYSLPLVSNGLQEGIIVIDLPEKVLYSETEVKRLIPLYVLLLCIGILVFRISIFVKRDVLNPINEIHKGTKAILKGSYGYKINYDYHGEVGGLCHDFEAMRDEIKVSKEREEELKRSEKELLASISHDLKTPLSSILGYVEGIRDGIVSDKKGIERYSNVILKKSREISKLIDDILEQSKADLNEMNINRKEIYSDEYLFEILEEVSLDVYSHNMNLVVKGEIPRALILIDELRITQVINNIVSNSIKYSKSGDSIEFSIVEKIDRLIINIKDYGSGISIEDIPFVFNKFYRGEKHRNTNIIGSGLGLSISKYIIESHGGNIKCTSSQDGGTTISFTIPKL